MALVLVFFVLPVLATVWMSFHNWPLMGEPRWIGLRNYGRMLTHTRLPSAIGFTAFYTRVVTAAIFALAFPLALFVAQDRRGVGAYRSIFFLPVGVGLATASLLWTWLANVDSGLFSPAMRAMSLPSGA